MKHLRLFAAAVMASMAAIAIGGAGTSSATVLCTSSLSPCPPESKVTTTFDNAIAADVKTGTSMELRQTSGEIFATCTGGTLTLNVSKAGSATETAVLSVTGGETWKGCGMAPRASGSLEIHHVPGTQRGTVTATGLEVTIGTGLSDCTYTTGTAQDMGLLTPSGPPEMAVLDVEAVLSWKSGGFCAGLDFVWLAELM
ncbi:MAG TPA: hypothetical protein VNR67_02980, partial [Solirubrobacterales bacterium]|nr:hypothetical protein [Solirubrobacterales bacterium]